MADERPSSSSQRRLSGHGDRNLIDSQDDEDAPFVKTCSIYEAYKRPIYACSFNPYQNDSPMLATVAGSVVNVYECPLDRHKIILRRSIKDNSPGETYYTVAWVFDTKEKRHRLVVGGMLGVLRVVDVLEPRVVQELHGHGEPINEVRTSPTNSNLIASVSKDSTVRLWNIHVPACLAIFGGYRGHNDQTLSVDWSFDGKFLVSASMDHSIRLWNLDVPEIQAKIECSMSDDWQTKLPARYPNEMGMVAMVKSPVAWNNDLHADYVDCVRFMGDLIIAKSTEQVMTVFRFGSFGETLHDVGNRKEPDTACLRLASLDLSGAEIWFMKTDVDPLHRWIVGGTTKGELLFWNIHKDSIDSLADFSLNACDGGLIRNIAFGGGGRIMVAVADNGSITRLDRCFTGDDGQKLKKDAETSTTTNDGNKRDSMGSAKRGPSVDKENVENADNSPKPKRGRGRPSKSKAGH